MMFSRENDMSVGGSSGKVGVVDEGMGGSSGVGGRD